MISALRGPTLFLLIVLLIPVPGAAQSNVDRVNHQLDSVCSLSFDNWKVSRDLKSAQIAGDPTSTVFDDSQWATLKIGESIYPDSVWMRKEITVPDRILGQPISGALRFLVSVDDYGYLWVNGESKGRFPWDGDFELTNDAKPGQHFLIAIKAINTGGPMRLLRAELETATSKPIREFVNDFSLSLAVGQKLLSFDTYQTNSNAKVDPGIDKSTIDRAEKRRLNDLLQSLVTRVDVGALQTGHIDKFKASIAAVRDGLKPVSEFAKQFTLFFDANAHIDAAWLWRSKETIQVCRNTFSSVMNMMKARPDFTYTQSSAAYYDWMQRLYPDLFRQMQDAAKAGRWEIVGGMWVEPDCNLPSGVSWARHLLYAKKYFAKNFGVDVKIGWNPDSFGYNGNMPMLYRNAGIDAFITQKIGWNETNVFPYRVFWWESPDSSRILSYFPFDYGNSIDNPFQLNDWLRQFEANTGFRKMLVLFGVGDHGGGPSLEMLSRIDHLKTLDIFPTIEFGTAGQYLDWLTHQDLATVPVWKDELYLEYHQGTYTTQANMKKFNRSNEFLLTDAEEFTTLATLYGRPYGESDLEAAWKKLLFNQFHDILPGSGIRPVYIDATADHQEVQKIGMFQLNGALHQLVRQVNTSAFKKGVPVVLFNPLSWQRTDIAHVRLKEGDTSSYAVFGDNGAEVPSQSVDVGTYQREIIFIARDVPSIGYAVYELRKQQASVLTGSPTYSPMTLENGSFKVSVDSTTGWVKSIVDKRNGKEILAGSGNRLQLLEDVPKEYDAWNIGLTGVEYPSKYRGAEIVEAGPVRTVLRLRRDYLKPGTVKEYPTADFPSSFFTQDIILYNGLDRIDFTTDVDWWEDHTMLKVAFPLAVSDTVASYEIPFGWIQRSTQMRNSWEKAKVEVPAEKWADVSNGEYGVSLLNNAKYGYDIKGNVMRLSLLRSPKWPDPTADRGKHFIQYALYPHAGNWRDGQTVERGYEFDVPLIAVMTDAHKGALPERRSFVSLGPSNLVVSSMKKAEDGDAWIIQWYDAKGIDCNAELHLPKAPHKAFRSSFMEEDGTPLQVKGTTLSIPTKSRSVVTVKVYF
ncbi:MAG TPA: glycoside hydrolase family 38 C-terminal domain-containing protein [Bacteroidota bacterium]|nr:glycoside hydrolase family 38 C-terminal domain-containing protein [Bacteroidota bacterium]